MSSAFPVDHPPDLTFVFASKQANKITFDFCGHHHWVYVYLRLLNMYRVLI